MGYVRVLYYCSAAALLLSLFLVGLQSDGMLRMTRQAMTEYQAPSERRRPLLRYQPELTKLPRSLIDKFELSYQDAETSEFLDKAKELSLLGVFFSNVLSSFFSRTTSNGITGRGFMYVFSTEQARRLLRPVGVSLEEYEAGKGTEAKFEKLLDIGAGDGGVTAKLEPLMGDVRNIFATEYSRTMRWRLGRRGYTVLGHENPFEKVNPSTQQPERLSYDLIALLNVLDRIDTPLDILQNIHASLTPSGYLLLAVVLPWCPFVEEGKRQVRPSQSLPMDGGKCCEGAKFEDSFSRLVENVLEPAGFELVRWTKLPYLCQGNLKLEYAVLHDAVMVLRKKEEQAP